MRESLSSATQIGATQVGTYTKFTPKQTATTLALLHVPVLLWSTGNLLSIVIRSYRTWGAYAASDALMTLTSSRKTY